jgi:hypothetical protein
MQEAVLVFVNEKATSEVKKRGLSIRMTELEKLPTWKRIAGWFKGTIKEYEETSLLVDYEGPHEITYSHESSLGLPDWLPKVEAKSGTSSLHYLKKLQELNDESALFFLFRIMRTRTPSELREIVNNPKGKNIKDVCYQNKVIKIAGIIKFDQSNIAGFELCDDNNKVKISEFLPNTFSQCKALLEDRKGVVIGMVGNFTEIDIPVIKCAGLFVES